MNCDAYCNPRLGAPALDRIAHRPVTVADTTEPDVKRHFTVAWNKGKWQLFIEGREAALLSAADRHPLVLLAAMQAAQQDGRVVVHTQNGGVDASLYFCLGVMEIDGYYDGDLAKLGRAAQPNGG